VFLEKGVPISNLSAPQDGQLLFAIVVPAGKWNLTIGISGGTGDADLYTRLGSQPTLSIYDCAPGVKNNTESCFVSTPQAGTYYVMVNAFQPFSGVTITASYLDAVPRPPGAIAVNFTVDDTANQVYTEGNLEWKGSMKYNSATRVITKDAPWSGPYPVLFDDGPWTNGGHEPEGSVAGDHVWGVTVYVQPPTTGSETYYYGLNDATYVNGWVWLQDTNGYFVVTAGATADITASGQTFPPFGNSDVRFVLDTSRLSPKPVSGSWDLSHVRVKSRAWNWHAVDARDDGLYGDEISGDGKYSLTLSSITGPGGPFPHSGLVDPGAQVEFRWVLGAGDGQDYNDANTYAADGGISASTRTGTSEPFGTATIGWKPTGNTYVQVP
jgi:hypothetical protein